MGIWISQLTNEVISLVLMLKVCDEMVVVHCNENPGIVHKSTLHGLNYLQKHVCFAAR